MRLVSHGECVLVALTQYLDAFAGAEGTVAPFDEVLAQGVVWFGTREERQVVPMSLLVECKGLARCYDTIGPKGLTKVIIPFEWARRIGVLPTGSVRWTALVAYITLAFATWLASDNTPIRTAWPGLLHLEKDVVDLEGSLWGVGVTAISPLPI